MTKPDSAIVVDLTKIPVRLPETKPIGFVSVTAPTHSSPLATLFYSVNGEKRHEGLPIDFAKGVFLGGDGDEPERLRLAILALHGVKPASGELDTSERTGVRNLKRALNLIMVYAAGELSKERAAGVLEAGRAGTPERSAPRVANSPNLVAESAGKDQSIQGEFCEEIEFGEILSESAGDDQRIQGKIRVIAVRERSEVRRFPSRTLHTEADWAAVDQLIEKKQQEAAWAAVDRFIEKNQPQNYDHAVALLIDLRKTADESGLREEFETRIRELRTRHRANTSLIERFEQAFGKESVVG